MCSGVFPSYEKPSSTNGYEARLYDHLQINRNNSHLHRTPTHVNVTIDSARRRQVTYKTYSATAVPKISMSPMLLIIVAIFEGTSLLHS